MNSNKNIPQLRFPEFTGEWEDKKLGDVCEIVMGQSPASENYNTEGVGLPLIQGNADIKNRKSIVRLYTNQITKTCEENDVLMSVRAPVGSISRASKKSCIGRGVCAIRNANDFMYQFLISIEPSWEKIAAGSTFTCVSSEEIGKRNIILPSDPAEQQKIAECLTAMDDMISAQGEKVDALKEKKKGMMQQMFPKKGETTPRLRFPGFTGEWGEKTLGEVADKVNSRNSKLEVVRVLTNSANSGVIDQNEYFDRDIAVKENTGNYHIVEINDFVYNPRISTAAPVGPISINKVGKGIMSPLYTIFRFHSGFIPFYEQYYQTTIWHSYLKSIANFGARFDRMNITTEGFFNMPLLIPSTEEQKKIAECLSAMDDMITSESAKLDALKDHKKGLMQQLFPQPNK